MTSKFDQIGEYECDICGSKWEKLQSYNAHRSHCKNKHKKNYKNRFAWNKGLTKDTDDRVKKAAENYSKKCKSGDIVPWQKGLSKDNNESLNKASKKISETVNKKIKEGTWHNSFSKSRTHEYKGVKLYGKWELEYAKWLDKNNVKWSRVEESFVYIFEGKEKQYTPDFYLIDEDCYIEIKGYETEKDRAKWSQFPLRLKVIKGEELFKLGLIESYKS